MDCLKICVQCQLKRYRGGYDGTDETEIAELNKALELMAEHVSTKHISFKGFTSKGFKGIYTIVDHFRAEATKVLKKGL